MRTYIIVAGNPVDGLSFVGPFDDAEEAVETAPKMTDGEWWVAPMDEAPGS